MWAENLELMHLVGWAIPVVGFGILLPLISMGVSSFQDVTERIYRRHRVSFRNLWFFWFIGIALIFLPPTVRTGLADWRVVSGMIAIIIGVLLVSYSVGNLPTYLRLKLTPTRDISEIKPGRVGAVGTVAATEQRPAPLSGTDSVAYQISIQSSSDGNHWDQELFTDERHPFTLWDYTGSVRIDPDGADFRFPREGKFNGTGTVDEDLPDRVTEYVSSLSGVSPSDTEIKYTEKCLEPETEIYVIGEAYRDTNTGELIIGNGSTFMMKPGTGASVTRAFRHIVIGGGAVGIGLVCCGLLLHYWPLW